MTTRSYQVGDRVQIEGGPFRMMGRVLAVDPLCDSRAMADGLRIQWDALDGEVVTSSVWSDARGLSKAED